MRTKVKGLSDRGEMCLHLEVRGRSIDELKWNLLALAEVLDEKMIEREQKILNRRSDWPVQV